MTYTGTYDDAHNALMDIMQHMVSFGVQLVSVQVVGTTLTLETDVALPEDQLEHLGLEVI